MESKRHKLLIGPIGTGKTAYARNAARTMFPTFAQSVAYAQSARIYRSAGLPVRSDDLESAPFRAPHHTASTVGLVGALVGGWRPRLGEVSLAHGGVLFLDNLPEFSRQAVESIYCAVRYSEVCISRGSSQVTIPASFRLIAAMNPCPCGYHGDKRPATPACYCTQGQVDRYAARIPQWVTEVCDVLTVDQYGGPS